jgi:hypothetical protein
MIFLIWLFISFSVIEIANGNFHSSIGRKLYVPSLSFMSFRKMGKNSSKIVSSVSLQQKLLEEVPIFEFKDDLETLFQQELYSSLELENILIQYLNKLRNYYFGQFLERTEDLSSSILASLNSLQSSYRYYRKKIYSEYEYAVMRSLPDQLKDTFQSQVK